MSTPVYDSSFAKSEIFEMQEAGSFRDRIDDKRKIEGTLQFAKIKVTLTGAEGSDATIKKLVLLRLPVGAIVRPEHIRRFRPTSGANDIAFTLGDGSDANRYGTIAIGTFVETPLTAGGVPEAFAADFKITEDTRDIIATIDAVTAAVDAGDLYFEIGYTCL